MNGERGKVAEKVLDWLPRGGSSARVHNSIRRRAGKSMHRAGLVLAVAVVTALCGPAAAQKPVALVEDVNAPRARVGFMDYVIAGQVIELGATGTLRLGYLKSCLSESIVGGRVTVGSKKSQVRGGTIETERVECDGGRLELSAEEAGKSAVLVLRRPPNSRAKTAARPSFKIYGASPFVRSTGTAGKVVIERLDRPGNPITVELDRGMADFAATGRALKPGGIYRAKSGEKSVVFDVDPLALPGPGPIIGRLVEF